eukprot:gene10334-12687_t
MKLISILLAVLFTIAVTSAYQCGPSACGFGEICHTLDGNCRCIPINDCRDVVLAQRVVNTWVDHQRGSTFTQIEVIIKNNLPRNIGQIFIGYDASLNLRDICSIWNVGRFNGMLTLPPYQPSINANSHFTFGFIVEGIHIPNLFIVATTFEPLPMGNVGAVQQQIAQNEMAAAHGQPVPIPASIPMNGQQPQFQNNNNGQFVQNGQFGQNGAGQIPIPAGRL